jgi:hypothetical protein
MARTKTNPRAGAAVRPGAAYTSPAEPKATVAPDGNYTDLVTGVFPIDPGRRAVQAYHPVGTDLRAQGSSPGLDPRDPKNPNPTEADVNLTPRQGV